MSASGIGRPLAFLYLSDNLVDFASSALEQAGFDPTVDVTEASIAIIEIGVQGHLRVLDEALDAGVRTIVIGQDPDDFVTVGLKAAGVWRVLRTAQFLADPASVLPLIA